ncbi:M48 family metallopeptidase [Paenibacillus chartarius]|uniref:M48 family metallopeptidase n=1 Tax=Paenibacillus chartarius TaxID=747481 RepID=A0ABV6DE35_9BACL
MNGEIQNVPVIENEKIHVKTANKYLWFVPGLYVILCASLLIMTCIGYGFYYFLLHIAPPLVAVLLFGAFLGVGIGVLLGYYSVFSGIFRSLFPRTIEEVGIVMNEAMEPELFEQIKDLCEQMHAEMPKYIILNARSAFFAADAAISLPNEKIRGTILSISLPMLYNVNIDELRSIVSHELAHFTGWDTKFSKKIAPVYQGAMTMLKRIDYGINTDRSDLASFMMVPSLIPTVIVRYYLKWFHNHMVAISRAREYRADAWAAQTCGTATYMSSLEKMHSNPIIFERVSYGDLTGRYKEGRGIINYFQVFRQYSDSLRGEVAQELQFARSKISSADDTHPTLTERLNNLPVCEGKSVSSDPAYVLLKHIEEYERVLSDELSLFHNNRSQLRNH